MVVVGQVDGTVTGTYSELFIFMSRLVLEKNCRFICFSLYTPPSPFFSPSEKREEGNMWVVFYLDCIMSIVYRLRIVIEHEGLPGPVG